MTSHFNFITYADDTTLCGAQTSHNDAKITEQELNKVTEWLKINKLLLNVKKTKAIVFHTPQKKVIVPILRINGTIVEFVDNFVFLGIQINKHLNWNHHKTDVANKIVKTVGILNTLNRYLLLNILLSVLLPVLVHVCSSFSNVLTLYVAIFSRSPLVWWFFLTQRFLAPPVCSLGGPEPPPRSQTSMLPGTGGLGLFVLCMLVCMAYPSKLANAGWKEVPQWEYQA